MKKTLIVSGSVILISFILLFAVNRIGSKRIPAEYYAKVLKGQFEISVISAGELVPERSVDIKGPEIAMGRDIRFFSIKIQDLVPEGVVVKEGDYIATLDRTDLNNSLKDAQDLLTTLQTALNVKLLDTAVVLNELRDGIKNQRFTVQEAEMTLHNSKYEPLPTIRQAEIELDKARRSLEQQLRGYTQVEAQNKTDIVNQTYWVNKVSRRVRDIEEILTEFTIKAPSPGMVIYKREWSGNPFDRVVATLPDLTSMLSKTYINEIDVSKIRTGQNVSITIDAFPKKSYNGTVSFVANVGEKMLNTDDKVFEIQIKVAGSDPELRPSMTTGNKIIVSSVKNAVYIPIECVQAGIDSIPYVFTKKGIKQIVLLGESNEKYVQIEKGLEEGTLLYLNNPENPEKFRLEGKDLVREIREKEKAKRNIAGMNRKKPDGVL
jgi:multidrug efflux pump subunit AcrA (membrane-fusion protein)